MSYARKVGSYVMYIEILLVLACFKRKVDI